MKEANSVFITQFLNLVIVNFGRFSVGIIFIFRNKFRFRYFQQLKNFWSQLHNENNQSCRIALAGLHDVVFRNKSGGVHKTYCANSTLLTKEQRFQSLD